WISHALLKILVFTLPGAAKFFDSVGIPGALVYPVVAAELLGGIAIITGLYGRQASLALLPVMLVAAWVHYPNGWVFTSTGGGWEYPVFLALMSVVHGLVGDGAFALSRSALGRFLIRHALDIGKPRRSFAVAGRPIVAAGRKRAA
ncbi:MAG: DoxX family protein, partial [Betaproteobacteria bacterium]